MKVWVMFLAVLLILPIAFSTVCTQETVIPCDVVTPYISCGTYEYWVYDSDGNIPQNGSLTSIGGGLYTFVLENVSINNVYTIKLCTNQTTQVTILPIQAEDVGKGSILFGLIITQILILLMFIYFQHILSNEGNVMDNQGNMYHKFIILRVLLVFISFVWIFKLYSVFTVIIENYVGVGKLIELAGISVFGWIFFVFISVYLFISLFQMFKMIKINKINRLEY